MRHPPVEAGGPGGLAREREANQADWEVFMLGYHQRLREAARVAVREPPEHADDPEGDMWELDGLDDDAPMEPPTEDEGGVDDIVPLEGAQPPADGGASCDRRPRPAAAEGPGRSVQTLLAPPPVFVSAPKFSGAREGMAFKVGASGLGYYRDDGPDGPAVAVRQGAQLTLSLDDLVPEGAVRDGGGKPASRAPASMPGLRSGTPLAGLSVLRPWATRGASTGRRPP